MQTRDIFDALKQSRSVNVNQESREFFRKVQMYIILGDFRSLVEELFVPLSASAISTSSWSSLLQVFDALQMNSSTLESSFAITNAGSRVEADMVADATVSPSVLRFSAHLVMLLADLRLGLAQPVQKITLSLDEMPSVESCNIVLVAYIQHLVRHQQV